MAETAQCNAGTTAVIQRHLSEDTLSFLPTCFAELYQGIDRFHQIRGHANKGGSDTFLAAGMIEAILQEEAGLSPYQFEEEAPETGTGGEGEPTTE